MKRVMGDDSGRTGLPAALKNEAAEQGRGDFAALSAQFQPFARQKTPVGVKTLVQQGRFRQSLRQAARHLGNVGLKLFVIRNMNLE